MLRKIKFRAWEPCNKKMYYLDLALYKFNPNSINSHSFVLPPERQGLHNAYTSMNLDAVEVMQYTGLKDKNGKDIYEGDLLKDDSGIGCVTWVQEHCAFLIFVSDQARYYLLESDGQLISSEVIGNVFEKPELK